MHEASVLFYSSDVNLFSGQIGLPSLTLAALCRSTAHREKSSYRGGECARYSASHLRHPHDACGTRTSHRANHSGVGSSTLCNSAQRAWYRSKVGSRYLGCAGRERVYSLDTGPALPFAIAFGLGQTTRFSRPTRYFFSSGLGCGMTCNASDAVTLLMRVGSARHTLQAPSVVLAVTPAISVACRQVVPCRYSQIITTG